VKKDKLTKLKFYQTDPSAEAPVVSPNTNMRTAVKETNMWNNYPNNLIHYHMKKLYFRLTKP
jgi:hypothetical protein